MKKKKAIVAITIFLFLNMASLLMRLNYEQANNWCIGIISAAIAWIKAEDYYYD